MGIWIAVAGLTALLAGYLLNRGLSVYRRLQAARSAEQRRAETARRAGEAVGRAREEAEVLDRERRARFEREAAEEREGLRELERLLDERERDLGRFEAMVAAKEGARARLQASVDEREAGIRGLRRELGELKGKERRTLLERAGLSERQARERLLGAKAQDIDRDIRRREERGRERLSEEADRIAREIISTVILRSNVDHLREERSYAVPFPRGRGPEAFRGEGLRLLEAFQAAAEVEVVVDEERGEVGFTALDGVRKEVARRSMKRLLEPGHMDPARIPDLVEGVRREVGKSLLKKGRGAVEDLALTRFHPRLLKTIGRLHYRTSYGQNILKHSREVATLCSLLAGELGLDAALARRCGFLHDLGKAVDAEVEGGHPEIGAELARRYGEDPVVVNAIEAHHEDQKRTSLYPLVVQAADAISGARPGARRRTLEKYLLRMEQIEKIATAPAGVEGAHVIQAGREVRVNVDPARVSDEDARRIGVEIARRLEKEMTFPGTIKVTVIRENRIVAFAR